MSSVTSTSPPSPTPEQGSNSRSAALTEDARHSRLLLIQQALSGSTNEDNDMSTNGNSRHTDTPYPSRPKLRLLSQQTTPMLSRTNSMAMDQTPSAGQRHGRWSSHRARYQVPHIHHIGKRRCYVPTAPNPPQLDVDQELDLDHDTIRRYHH